MTARNGGDLVQIVERLFDDRGFIPTNVKVRTFPNETIVVVELEEDFLSNAIKAGPDIEAELPELLTNPLILNNSKMPEFWSPAPDDVANRAGQKRACASRSIGWNWFMIF